MTTIAVNDLVVKFGSMAVLRDLNLEVKSGEFLVLLGSSGCGKSTLLNAIAGLLEPSGGMIAINDSDVTHVEPDKRGIAMVFQSYALYPKMTVEGNLGFALRVAGVPKKKREERVHEVAEFLQIKELLKRRPAQLSGGQRQRVAIGRALVREAETFLFDEPLSNLDAKLRAELRVEIKRLHRSTGKTMIYVTHDQVEALTLADRIAIMKDGVIQQLASPETIYDCPANRYVAGFIGSPRMNFLKGELVQDQDGPVFESKLGRIPLSGYGFAAQPQASAKVDLGVRPEMLRIVDPNAPEAGLHGVVDLIEMQGAESIVWCDVGGQQIALLIQGKSPVRSGAEIGLAFDAAEASVFFVENGQRV